VPVLSVQYLLLRWKRYVLLYLMDHVTNAAAAKPSTGGKVAERKRGRMRDGVH